jgi:hypothetical protein
MIERDPVKRISLVVVKNKLNSNLNYPQVTSCGVKNTLRSIIDFSKLRISQEKTMLAAPRKKKKKKKNQRKLIPLPVRCPAHPSSSCQNFWERKTYPARINRINWRWCMAPTKKVDCELLVVLLSRPTTMEKIVSNHEHRLFSLVQRSKPNK